MKMIKNPSPITPDEIFQLNSEFNQDSRKNKINGGLGVYTDELGKPYIMPAVKKAISLLNFSNFNYLPIAGHPTFLEQSSRLILGEKLFAKLDKDLAKQGVMGGTNGLFLWANYVKQIKQKPLLLLGQPTWENHRRIFSYCGFDIKEYPHLDKQGHFNLTTLKKALDQYPRAYLLLHGGSTHNPTGVNPTFSQWQELSDLIKKKQRLVCFDFAYMGLGENLEKDCLPIRLFLKNHLPVTIVVSYAKNMSLYQHRTGLLLQLTASPSEKASVESHWQYLFRIINSNPSAFGELIVKTILENESLKAEWLENLNQMVTSLNRRRKLFVETAGEKYRYILNHKGLFSLIGLDQSQVERIKKDRAIYLLSNSRINFGSLALKDIPRLSKAILEVSS